MATVVQSTTENTQPISSFMSDAFGLVPLLLFGAVFITICIVVFMLIRRMSDERKAMTDPLYSNYRNTMVSGVTQADFRKIRNVYSLINLLWLGIPFKKNEYSSKVFNFKDEFIGYYRGHFNSQDMNSLNLILYKTKSFLIFEDRFILKCPRKVAVKVKNEKTKKYEEKSIDFSSYINELPNGDYKIYCASIQRFSYFWIPNYMWKNQEVYDIRKQLNENIMDLGYSEMITRVMSVGSAQVEKAMEYNPAVKYPQMTPKKTKNEDEEEIN